jgi:hypothetical protein
MPESDNFLRQSKWIDPHRAQAFWAWCGEFNKRVKLPRRKEPGSPLLAVRPAGFRDFSSSGFSQEEMIADARRREEEAMEGHHEQD